MALVSCIVVIFFFFKQKTAYEMRISDWSSDVCSSDLRKIRPRRCRRWITDLLGGRAWPSRPCSHISRMQAGLLHRLSPISDRTGIRVASVEKFRRMVLAGDQNARVYRQFGRQIGRAHV